MFVSSPLVQKETNQKAVVDALMMSEHRHYNIRFQTMGKRTLLNQSEIILLFYYYFKTSLTKRNHITSLFFFLPPLLLSSAILLIPQDSSTLKLMASVSLLLFYINTHTAF